MVGKRAAVAPGRGWREGGASIFISLVVQIESLKFS